MRIATVLGAMSLMVGITTAQTVPGGKADATFEGLDKSGASVVVSPKAGPTNLGQMTLTGNGRGGTDVGFDFTRLAPTKQTLKLYSGNLLIREMPYRGPSVPHLEMTASFLPIEGATLVSEDENWVWLLAAAIVAWCVHSEESTTTTYDANGNVTGSTVTESLGWDCSGGMVVTAGGSNYANVTRMEVVAETGTALPAVTSTSFSATGGARIKSVR